jgi:hypothetical protein
MLTPGGIFIRNPRLMFGTENETPGGGNEQEQQEENQPEPKFPTNTPVKDMTPEQQAAYHENKARRLEDKLKGFNGLTPKQVADLQAEISTLKNKSQSTEEKALEEAKEQGRAEERVKNAHERVKYALEKALAGRVPDASALLDLDRSKFIKDGTADVEAIQEWVAENSTAPTEQKKAPNLGQGKRQSMAPARGERGREEAQKRFKKTKTSTDS